MRSIFLLPLLLASLTCRAQTTNAAPAPESAPAANAADVVPSGPIDPAKEAEVRKFIANSGVKENLKTTMARSMDTYRKKYPDVPADFWMQLDSDANLDDFVSRLVPVYAQFCSIEDMKAMNAFYDSPAGQHMRAAQPKITAGQALVARQWGREMGAKIMAGIMTKRAETYAAEDKKHYYTAVSTNDATSAPVASAPVKPPSTSVTAPVASPAPAAATPAPSPLGDHD